MPIKSATYLRVFSLWTVRVVPEFISEGGHGSGADYQMAFPPKNFADLVGINFMYWNPF